MQKSTPDEIRERFDNDVERFSNLQTGQSATIDAPLVLDLITDAVAAINLGAKFVLDVGCGAGNYTVKLLGKVPGFDATLIDLSGSMLERAKARVQESGARTVHALQGDIREVTLETEQFDVIMAAAVLHHLRADAEWKDVFKKLFASLRPGGSLWISDLVEHENPLLHRMMWKRYGDYLTQLKSEKYRDDVFAYVEREDSPRSLEYQMELMKEIGFKSVTVLHKNGPFAAFGAIKEK